MAGPLLAFYEVLVKPKSVPLAGYVAWYDASQIVGFADAASLTSWADASGNGHTLINAPGASHPTYYSSTGAKLVNGLPAVWFDHASQTGMYNSAGFGSALSQPFSVAVVAKVTNNTQDCNITDGGPTNDCALGVASSTFEMFAGSLLNDGASDANLHLFAGVYNAGSSVLYIDGSSVASGAAGSNALNQFLLGNANTGTGLAMSGPICEALVYHSALSSGQVSSLRTYAQTKWGTP